MVKRHEFKTCDQNYFCKSNREIAKNKAAKQDRSSSLRLKGETLALSSDAKSVQGLIEDTDPIANPNKVNLNFELRAVSERTFQLLVSERNPDRFVAPEGVLVDTAFDKAVPFKEVSSTDSKKVFQLGEDVKVHLNFSPFSVDIYEKDELVIQGNSRGLMRVEQWRTEDEDRLLFVKPESLELDEEEEDQTPQPTVEERWKETFNSKTDNKKHGPSSISMDWTFVNSDSVYGIPEHADHFALTSTRDTDPYRLYNLDVFEYELHEKMALYGAVPLMISQSQSAKTTGVFFLNSAEMYIDIDHLNEQDPSKHQVDTHWIAETGSANFFVIVAKDPKDFYKQWATLVGFPQLPPIFSIGYHQCKWNYKDEKEVAEIDSGFDEIGCPLDVVWLDIEHTDSKKYFTWDQRHFPTPDKMLQAMEEKGRHMVTIIDPHIKRENNYHVFSESTSADIFVKDAEGKTFEGHCWPGSSSWIDFTLPEAQQKWASFFDFSKYSGSRSNLFTWNDMNEPSVFSGPEITMPKTNLHKHGKIEHRDIHNIYGKLFHEATYQGHLHRDPNHNARPFVLTRSFFAGSQRTAAVWTGDNTAAWGHLEIAQPMLLSLGAAGISFAGSDVGGFFQNADAELLTRWYQAASFHPFFREHGELTTKRKEPFLWADPHRSVMVQAIRQRYALLPYMYSLFWKAATTGVPVMRALWMEYPTQREFFREEQAFLLGSDLLIRPVIASGTTSVSVPLPGDQPWYDFFTGAAYKPENSRVAEIHTPLEKIPVLQRGGSVIPTKQRVRRSTTQMASDPITLFVALDSNGAAVGDIYVDDGQTLDYATASKFLHTTISMDKNQNNNSFTLRNAVTVGNWAQSGTEVERIVVYGWETKANKVVEEESGASLDFVLQDQVLTIRKPQVTLTDAFLIKIE